MNLAALTPYLVENGCITLEEARQFHPESPQSNNILKLIDIMCKRGISAFNSFVKSLVQFTNDEPGEGAHRELLDTLETEMSRTRPTRGAKHPPPTGVHFEDSTDDGKLLVMLAILVIRSIHAAAMIVLSPVLVELP